MKTLISTISVCLLLFTCTAFAQQAKADRISTLESTDLQIGYTKTTSIVFPYAIKSVDRGSQDILVQMAKGVENILLLKAGVVNFNETNLTVVTADGSLYSYILHYEEHCPALNLIEEETHSLKQGLLFSSENENQKEMQQYAQLALSKKMKISCLKEKKYYIQLEATGLFIHQEVMYFRLVFSNLSNINYTIDQLRFFTRDQKKSKRTASQEIEMFPLLETTKVKTIPAKSEITVVFALPKFTIPENKYFAIQLIEKGGGRTVELDVKTVELDHIEVLSNL
jgi:conjugative transposon TraN protein